MNTYRVFNVSSVPHRSPFRFPGGKTWFVPYVRQWLNSLPSVPHQLSEPFAGGAIVGLSALFEGRCKRLSLIELDDNVAAVWQTILNGNAKKLANKISDFNVSHDSVRFLLAKKPRSILEQAFIAIVRNRVQRGGIMAPGASLMKNGENGRGLLSRWYPETLRKRILAIAEMRDSVCFIQADGVEYLKNHADLENMVFFIDPPYTIAGRRLYVHSEVDHEEIFRIASEMRGDFLMTYDNADDIRRLADHFGFDMETVPMKNTHHTVMSELIVGRNLDWLRSNSQLHQNSLFKSV